MSDATDSQMEIAEIRRLERLLNLRKKEIDDIEKKADLRRPRNRRYNVDFGFAAQDYPYERGQAPLYVETKTATVNKNSRFYCKAIERHYAITSAGATFNIGPSYMRAFLGFDFKISDTGSDREWQNTWLPDAFLCSGDRRGRQLGRNHALLSGAAELEVSVRVNYMSNGTVTGSLLESIEKILLQISFVGIEVPEGET